MAPRRPPFSCRPLAVLRPRVSHPITDRPPIVLLHYGSVIRNMPGVPGTPPRYAIRYAGQFISTRQLAGYTSVEYPDDSSPWKLVMDTRTSVPSMAGKNESNEYSHTASLKSNQIWGCLRVCTARHGHALIYARPSASAPRPPPLRLRPSASAPRFSPLGAM